MYLFYAQSLFDCENYPYCFGNLNGTETIVFSVKLCTSYYKCTYLYCVLCLCKKLKDSWGDIVRHTKCVWLLMVAHVSYLKSIVVNMHSENRERFYYLRCYVVVPLLLLVFCKLKEK